VTWIYTGVAANER